MRRDIHEAVERFAAIDRYRRQFGRWITNPPEGVAEEDYDALHEALREAESALSRAYRQWHAIPKRDAASNQERSVRRP